MAISREPLIYPSFPRKRESMLLIPLDSRFRGNDDCGINKGFAGLFRVDPVGCKQAPGLFSGENNEL